MNRRIFLTTVLTAPVIASIGAETKPEKELVVEYSSSDAVLRRTIVAVDEMRQLQQSSFVQHTPEHGYMLIDAKKAWKHHDGTLEVERYKFSNTGKCCFNADGSVATYIEKLSDWKLIVLDNMGQTIRVRTPLG